MPDDLSSNIPENPSQSTSTPKPQRAKGTELIHLSGANPAIQGKPGLNKAVVQAFKSELQSRGLAPSTINLKLCAVRKLILEISDNGLLDPLMAANIAKVKGIRTSGVRTGNWLSREQAQRLINTPDISTFKGLRFTPF